MINWIQSALMSTDPFRSGGRGLSCAAALGAVPGATIAGVNCNKEFIIGHMNIHCKTTGKDGRIVPAELALAKFTLADGIKATYHRILRLDDFPIPEGKFVHHQLFQYL